MTDAATPFLDRVRVELRAAMRLRDPDTVRALRMLIAVVDNAQSVPLDSRSTSADRSPQDSERPRKALSAADLAAILQAEIQTRLDEVSALETVGQNDAAAAPAAEARLFQVWLPIVDKAVLPQP